EEPPNQGLQKRGEANPKQTLVPGLIPPKIYKPFILIFVILFYFNNNSLVKTTGYILLLISCISFLMILVVPWLGFTKIQIAGITTGLIIAGEILFYLSLFLLGRGFYDKIKSKLKFRKSKTNASGLHGQIDQNSIPIE
ncbi:MAG TPA: hypothetical protein DEO60_06155, partial [Bacteroidales bacterium]|nr:hypothetical protein [Bacteroidales bacterium]